VIFRALAVARDEAFYRLALSLPDTVTQSPYGPTFRIFKVFESLESLVVVAVAGSRPDGIDVCWSLVVRASDAKILVEATVELTDEEGTRDVYSQSHSTLDAVTAARLIGECSADVCAQTHWAIGSANA